MTFFTHGLGRCCGVLLCVLILTGTALAESDIVLISQDAGGVYAKARHTGETLYQDADALKVLTWAMTNHRITVVGRGTYKIAAPISIPRPGVSLVIDEGATVDLAFEGLSGKGPFAPRVPVIYNQGHDDVTVINLGNIVGQARTRGTGIFDDGRKDGDHGIKGGRIVHAGMLGWTDQTGSRPSVHVVASLADCQSVQVPLLFGDGYRSGQLEAEGCKDLDIGLVTAAPRASNGPVTLTGLNEDTRVRRLVATQPMGSGVLVRNSPRTIVDDVRVYGDPMAFVKIFHIHEYGPYNARFTQRPFFLDSEGSRAVKESIVNQKVKDWPQTVSLVDFPQSLPNLKVKVALDAVFEDGGSERVIDKVYDLDLLSATDFEQAPEFLFITTDGATVRAVGGKSNSVRFEDADARVVIEWAMANAPITVLQDGVYTVPGVITVPRENISLVIGQGAELRQDPAIEPPTMAGDRGGYRPLIHNPGHDHVEIVNLGTLRPYSAHRGVAIHFDGRTDRTVDRKTFIESGREGGLNLDGGIIFATGPMYADDVVWVVDAKNVRIPLLLSRGYSNAPLALEGVEDMKIGTLAALMGDQAFENEAVDFNSFCQRIHIELVIGTTPTEEVVDINNSRDCVIDEVRVFRTSRDVMPVRFHNWPDRQGRSPKLMSQRPEVSDSDGTVLHSQTIVEKPVRQWTKSVQVSPLAQTLPLVKISTLLTVTYEDGTEEEVVKEDFEWAL
jgi:hypothetical protein